MNKNRQLAQATSKQILENKDEEELQGEKKAERNMLSQVPPLFHCLYRSESQQY